MAITFDAKSLPQQELLRLLETHVNYTESGFSISLVDTAEQWHREILRLGRPAAYALMSAYVCSRYAEQYGAEFLFSEDCVAREIRIHVDAYLRCLGYPGYPVFLPNLLLPRKLLVSRVEVVDIYCCDIKSLPQRLVFRYRAGIRSCYRGGSKDPFAKRRRR